MRANSSELVFLPAFLRVNNIRRARLEVVSAAVRAPHGFPQLVQGAQVEHKRLLVGEDFIAELAHHLQADKDDIYM